VELEFNKLEFQLKIEFNKLEFQFVIQRETITQSKLIETQVYMNLVLGWNSSLTNLSFKKSLHN